MGSQRLPTVPEQMSPLISTARDTNTRTVQHCPQLTWCSDRHGALRWSLIPHLRASLRRAIISLKAHRTGLEMRLKTLRMENVRRRLAESAPSAAAADRSTAAPVCAAVRFINIAPCRRAGQSRVVDMRPAGLTASLAHNLVCMARPRLAVLSSPFS
jgi:hypothetical protein